MRPTKSRSEAAASCPSCSGATLPGAYYAHGSSSSGAVPGARSIVVAGSGGKGERSQEKMADDKVNCIMAESPPLVRSSSRRELAKKIEDMNNLCQGTGTVSATVSAPHGERNNSSRAGRVRNACAVSAASTSGTTRPVIEKTCVVVEPAPPPVEPAVTQTSFYSREIAKATTAAAAAALSVERRNTSTTNTSATVPVPAPKAAAKATDADASLHSSAFDDSAVVEPASCHGRKQSARTAKPPTNSPLLPPPPPAAITTPNNHHISQSLSDDDDNDNDNNSSTTMDSDDLKIQQLRRQLLQLRDTPKRGQTVTTATPPTRSLSVSFPSAASSERHCLDNKSHGRQSLPYQRSTSVQLHFSDVRTQQLQMTSVSLSSSSCSRNSNHDSNKNHNNSDCSKNNQKGAVHDHDEGGNTMPPLDSTQDRSAHGGPHHNNNSIISTKNSHQCQYHHHQLVEKDSGCRTSVTLSASHHDGVSSSSSHNAPSTAAGASGSRLHLMRRPSNDTDHIPKTHTSSHTNKAVAGDRGSEAVTSADADAHGAGEGRGRRGGNIILLDVPQSGDVLGQMEAYQPSTTEQADHLHNANQQRELQCTSSSHTKCTTTQQDDDDDDKGTNAGLASYSVPSPSSPSSAAPSSSRLLQRSVSSTHHRQCHRQTQNDANRHSAGRKTMSTTSIGLSAGDERRGTILSSRHQVDTRTLQEQHPLSSSRRNHGSTDTESEAKKVPGSFSCCFFNDEGLNRKMKDFQQQLQEYEDRQEAKNNNKGDKSVRFAINDNTDKGNHCQRPSSNNCNNYASQSMPSLPTTSFGHQEDQHQKEVHTNTRSLSAPCRLNASSSSKDPHHLHNKNNTVTRRNIIVDDDDDPLFLKEIAKQGVESKCSCAIM